LLYPFLSTTHFITQERKRMNKSRIPATGYTVCYLDLYVKQLVR